MLRIVLILFTVLPACLIYGQNAYLLDSITSASVNSGSGGSLHFTKFNYDDSCRLIKHKTDLYTTTYLYDKNTITIDVANTFTSSHLNTTVEQYTDFDSLLTSETTNILGLSNVDSFFYNEDHNLIRKKKYKFDDGVQYLNTDSKLTYINGLVETDSILIYNSGGLNTYFENHNYAYDQAGNEILHLLSDNYSFSTINKDSIISIYVDDRIIAKHEFIFYDNHLLSETKWETSYSDEYTTTDISNRFDQDDPYKLLQRTKYHHVDEPIYDYDTVWVYGESDENAEFLISRLIQSWIYNDDKDTMEIRQFRQHFDVDQKLTFTISTRNHYFRKQSELPDNDHSEEDYFTNYPNPSASQQVILIESNQVFDQITLYDDIGRKVLDIPIEFTKTYELASDLTAGLYFISLAYKGKALKKINKQIIIK